MCYKDIREKVKRIKNQYESCNPLTIIKELNIVPAFFAQDIADELPDGCYFKSEGIAFILIDSTLNEHERNITYAHELGHAILHPDVDTLTLEKYNKNLVQKYENEANIFAAELLLDDNICHNYQGYSAHEIAKSEYVSVELVRYKYNSLYKSNFTFKNYA
ncbi:ImmA/IrrE family metallo-endopeptidase [Romboutsia sedimentorum]|uniref:ImmA/IrrE family metallo-endopeptidase n=1 Tax=Romboutsia sedimentorum TaxID=1368474 RepID=A0ABT7E8L7_9FIRM|nr:ImmA/IrrE family metallo-endopeptidase [Romboutsia sedimentorum]MDK2563269.1 ImmA/IrrE family metallo-endopeptidase [Romboutsia sedimentorum]MDK2584996.1 ImmA/IrrE family metallo-endopeptidase [Romboutsia sedimentorum]